MMVMTMLLAMGCVQAQENVGVRPYELDWAGRVEDDNPPLIDFEQMGEWRVETENSVARFEQSREQQIWGDYVAKLTYRLEVGSSTRETAGSAPVVHISPPEPVAIAEPFDAATMWVNGNNWGGGRDLTTPSVAITLRFTDSEGEPFDIALISVRWKDWFLCHKRLTTEQIERVRDGATFTGFDVRNGRNKADRAVYFDNLAVFTEKFAPLHFDPRPLRGIDMFPGQATGTNTGPGRLPFPTREQTILPRNLTDDFTTDLAARGDEFVFTYAGADGKLQYRLKPEAGTWSDITAQWEGRGDAFRPCVDGGAYLQTADGTVMPDSAELIAAQTNGDTVEAEWLIRTGDVSAQVQYTFRLWGKSLVIDTICAGGQVGEVRYGHLEGLADPRVVTNPYYSYASKGRPAVAITGPETEPLFVTGNTDWYLSNATEPFASAEVKDGRAVYNGGTRYVAKTDGERNDCFERFFVTVTPRYEETLPTISNPVSPWKQITGTKFWRAHGAGNRENDMSYWKLRHRYGITEMVVTDHETMWRDGGESFTFRTKAAPGKGGDQGAYDYARFMQDELGYTYGPYNNFTDFAPVNEYWSVDRVTRQPDNQLRHAWMRCYAPKPAFAVEACAELAPQIEAKYHFSTAYCDVHTAVSPWSRVDYDARVPGAGTFAATLYSFGEIMMLQKQAWDGPVYSEGNMHWPYVGLTDGNYAQDQRYNPADNPWLVDFDLREMHPLCCNFGMGNPGMFYGRKYDYGETAAEVDANLDRFCAATVAFGHPGFLTSTGGLRRSLRSYFMLQQLHARYCLAGAESILYADADGALYDTTSAVATGAYKRSQLATRYDDGTVTVVNGSRTERMRVNAYGRDMDLPPNGYAGWTADGEIEVISSDALGHRCDYAVTPDHIFVDGRDVFTRFEKAAGNGLGICRILDDGSFEIIPYDDAECGFEIGDCSAVALAEDESELGPADVRCARGLTYVMPVEGAFSYILTPVDQGAAALACDRDRVMPGERVVVRGRQDHELQVPQDAAPGDRIWERFEDEWIDFTVAPLAVVDASLDGNTLVLNITSNAPREDDLAVTLADETETLRLKTDESGEVTFDLGEPEHEDVQVLEVGLQASELTGSVEYGMRILDTMSELVELPAKWSFGIRLRGQDETADVGDTRAYAGIGSKTAGGITRECITTHPPWVGGTGYTYVLYDPVELPAEPPAAFRASVCKGDGSDMGDGILYKIAVVDEAGEETIVGEQTVINHEWLEIEGDLSDWAGRTVRIKLIADCGPNDDTTGDWAGWAGMRIETQDTHLTRILDDVDERYRREAGPFMIEGLTLADLRAAAKGWLHYDGIGLSGTGEPYGTFAVVNGIELGNMEPAGGSETTNVWDENKSVALTPEAIGTLDFRNVFMLKNPGQDWFKVRRFWLELELADGRKCSTWISTAAYTQPPSWPYAEGIGVPFTRNIEADIWFPR
jgi:hypothetical protein